MKPIIQINNLELWFNADDDASGDPGYYWMNCNLNTSDERYHSEKDAIIAMNLNMVTFDEKK